MANLTLDERNKIHFFFNTNGIHFNLGWDDDALIEIVKRNKGDVAFFEERVKKEEDERATVLKEQLKKQIELEKQLETLRKEEDNDFDHIVTQVDMDVNPILSEFGVKLGDIIGIPIFSLVEEKTPPEQPASNTEKEKMVSNSTCDKEVKESEPVTKRAKPLKRKPNNQRRNKK